MAWTTWVQLCGGLAVAHDGVRVEQRLPGRQGRLALAYLVANDDHWVTRDELAYAVWGEDEPPEPDAALASMLSKIRKVVGPDLLQGRSSLRFVRDDQTQVDLHHAREALHRAQVHVKAGRPDLGWQPAHTACAVARRRFMQGYDAPWIHDWRMRVELLLLDALEAVARTCLGIGDLPMAERAAQDVVSLAPFRESGYYLLMCAQERAGNRANALLVYDRLRCLLSDELGTVPGPEVAQVHQRLLGAG